MTTHDLKITSEYFKEVYSGNKKFEVRFNDRNFKVGDRLKLNEYYPDGTYSGESILVKVTYILDDKNYCKDGYVIMSIEIC